MPDQPDAAGTHAARFQSWRPPGTLAPYVPAITAYDVRRPEPGTHRGLPSTALTMVLPVGEPLDVGWHGRAGSRTARWSCVSGLHTCPAEIYHSGRQAGVQLALTPLGARALFGLPAGELSGLLIDLDDVAPALADLPERLAYAGTWRERLALVHSRLRAQLARAREPLLRPEVAVAWQELSGSRQPSPVTAVAAGVGLSRRRLSDLFRTEYGLTPKQFQRVARFQTSRQALVARARTGRVSVAEVAAACGYTDQAHLTNEWSALTGYTPTGWLRAEFPFVQDLQAEATVA